MRTHNSAFTLIELLVVIAIIAILAAILFPVFAQAKEAAKKTQDLSNQKNLTLAVQMYLQDYDDVFHMIRNGTWELGMGCPSGSFNAGACRDAANGAENMLFPYTKNMDIWSAPNDGVNRYDADRGRDFGAKLSYSFSYNNGSDTTTTGFGVCGWKSVSGTDSRRASAVGNTGNTVIMYPLYATWSFESAYVAYRSDNRQIAFALETWPKYSAAPNAWSDPQDKLTIGAYSGNTNFGFADGHVKSMKRNQVMDALWYSNAVQARDNGLRNLVHWDERFKN
jgi:prepilin-type N-terminal cleavage/methylation domain-containing protein/prepilin-type processing-associated H-X9-DG protein